MEEESLVNVRVELKSRRRFFLWIALSPTVTCADLVDTVKDCTVELGMCTADSQWNLIESWHGIEKKLSGNSNFEQILNSWNDLSSVCYIVREKGLKPRKRRRSSTTICSGELRRELRETKKEIRQLRLTRVKTDLTKLQTDPIRQGLQEISSLSDKLDTMRKNKEQLATEVFDMNHEATRLTEQLTVLRRTSQTLSDSLTQASKDKERRQREEEKEREERLAKLNEAVSNVQTELEKRQRMSELQDSKIALIQDEIITLQSSLNQRDKELEKMRQWADKKTQAIDTTLSVDTVASQNLLTTISRDKDGRDSFKRRFLNLNKKTKELVGEEARVFREAAIKSQGQIASDSSNESGSSNMASDSNQKRRLAKEEKKGILKSATASEKTKRKDDRKIQFEAKALLLCASGDGDLDLIKKCIKELGGCHQVVSSKGATCLHNAVCSGSLSTMEYFIDLGCDVNAQDCEGWTPLHCAAGYTHLPAIHLLLRSGASLYLRTSDNQLSIDLVQEAVAADESDIDAMNCFHYLTDCWSNLGLIRERRVFALFNYIATSHDELSFMTGEELTVLQRTAEDEGWWRAENAQGFHGYVPSTFLGLYPRKQVIV